MFENMDKLIMFVDGIRVLRLYDGKWYCLFIDYTTQKTQQLACYSRSQFMKWCEKNNLIPIV